MSEKILKIKRDICLIKYRNLPLIEYEKETDSDIYYFPKTEYFYWIKLEKENSKTLISELVKLLKLLELKTFIFLNAKNKSWISKQTENEKILNLLLKVLNILNL